MNFLKRLLQGQPLTLTQLFELNSSDGLYRGEILNALRDVVVFVALTEQPKGPFILKDSDTPFLVIPAPDNRSVFMLVFVDQVMLKQQCPDAFPYMVDFGALTQVLSRPHFGGLIVGCNSDFVTFHRSELLRKGLISEQQKTAEGLHPRDR